MFNNALKLAKEVRLKTKIFSGNISYAGIAYKEIRKVYNDLNGKKFILIGTGTLAETVLKYFSKNKIKIKIVSGKHYEKAVNLANIFDTEIVHYDKLKKVTKDADVIIVAANAVHYLVNKDDINDRKNNCLIFDLSVTRNVNPEVINKNVFLYNLDDLKNISDGNIEIRKNEISEVEKIIEKQINEIKKDVNNLIIEKAKKYKTIIRLKNGDPIIFGRINEEISALKENNIDFEIIPGITTASISAAVLNIGLTKTKIAPIVTFITGHENPLKKSSSVNFNKISKFGTLVFYMVVDNLYNISKKLISVGWSKETPCAIVEKAGFKDEKKIVGRLKDIKILLIDIKAPAVFIVGRVLEDEIEKIIKIAKKYSKADFVHLTTRQSLEIISVDLNDYNKVKSSLEKIGQSTASCGPRVRVATGCGGCEYNARGIIDAQKYAIETDNKYFGIPTIHGKFKISFAGCPSDCTRAKGADIGFVGEIEPKLNEKICNACSLCVGACLEGAISLDKKKGKPIRNISKCIFCGDCIKICPTSAWFENKIGCGVYVGGRWGRHPRTANLITHLFQTKNIYSLIEYTIEWYKKNGKTRERIGNTIDRLGVDTYMNEIRGFLK